MEVLLDEKKHEVLEAAIKSLTLLMSECENDYELDLLRDVIQQSVDIVYEHIKTEVLPGSNLTS